MSGGPGTSESDRAACSECGEEIDRCEFCDDPGCPLSLCFACVRGALGQIVAHPHAHDG